MSATPVTSKASCFPALLGPETPETSLQENVIRTLRPVFSVLARQKTHDAPSGVMFPVLVSVLTVSMAMLAPMIQM